MRVITGSCRRQGDRFSLGNDPVIRTERVKAIISDRLLTDLRLNLLHSSVAYSVIFFLVYCIMSDWGNIFVLVLLR